MTRSLDQQLVNLTSRGHDYDLVHHRRGHGRGRGRGHDRGRDRGRGRRRRRRRCLVVVVVIVVVVVNVIVIVLVAVVVVVVVVVTIIAKAIKGYWNAGNYREVNTVTAGVAPPSNARSSAITALSR